MPVFQLIKVGGNLEVFHPAGATDCNDGVKLGINELIHGQLFQAKFHPITTCDEGVGSPKTINFLQLGNVNPFTVG